MGVSGGRFLPTMKQLCTLLKINYRCNLYEVCEEQLLGIDGHGFLHRAVAVPEHALAIIFDDDYSLAAGLFGIWINQMKEHGVTPRVVFDGAVTPGKRAEKAARSASAKVGLEAVRAAGLGKTPTSQATPRSRRRWARRPAGCVTDTSSRPASTSCAGWGSAVSSRPSRATASWR